MTVQAGVVWSTQPATARGLSERTQVSTAHAVGALGNDAAAARGGTAGPGRPGGPAQHHDGPALVAALSGRGSGRLGEPLESAAPLPPGAAPLAPPPDSSAPAAAVELAPDRHPPGAAAGDCGPGATPARGAAAGRPDAEAPGAPL